MPKYKVYYKVSIEDEIIVEVKPEWVKDHPNKEYRTERIVRSRILDSIDFQSCDWEQLEIKPVTPTQHEE